MSLLDSTSHECAKSELDLFHVGPTQTSIESSYYVKYYPLTSLERSNTIEYVIKTDAKSYLDLQATILYMKCRIMKHDNEPIAKVAATDANYPKSLVAPICYFNSTLFKNVEVYLNGKPCSHADNLYAYKAYLESLLTFSSEAKSGQLQCALYYQDEGDDLDAFVEHADDADSTENPGLTKRLLSTQFSKPFETFGRIHSELFVQPKLIPGGTELRIKLHRNEPDFCLFAKTDTQKYVVSIDSSFLLIRHCEISPHVRESHLKMLQTHNMKFPVRRIEMKFFSRAGGRNDLSEQNLVSGLLPRRVIVGLVESDAFNSKLTKNPMNFQNFQLSSLILRRNGVALPWEELDVDYAGDCYSQAYMSLFQGTGKLFSDEGFAVSYDQFKNGFCLYGFDLSSDMGGCGTFDLITEGKLSLEVKLKTPHSTSITMVVYLEFDSLYEIDKSGNVFGNE